MTRRPLPELPEVEVVRRGLERWISGRVIAGAEVLHPRAVRRHVAGPGDFTARLPGARVDVVRRRGKYLWLPLDAQTALVAHLGMSGQLLVQPGHVPDEKHLRVRLTFADVVRGELRFVDQRTFGGLSLHRVTADGLPDVLAHIARDPLDPAFDEDAFHDALRRSRTTIKRALLDQSLVSGVGNIYADEALFRARLHPLSQAGSMKPEHAEDLVEGIVGALEAGLANGGSSIDDYRDARGEKGSMQDEFLVHTREGESCVRCGETIRRVVVGGRSTYFCPGCQRRLRARPRRRAKR